MNWTRPADLRAQVQKLWDNGRLLAMLVEDQGLFPLRLQFKRPRSAELATEFDAVRTWIAALQAGATCYRVQYRQIRHRVLGENAVPVAVWVDSLADALGFIGKTRAAERFAELAAITRQREPAAVAVLRKRPIKVLSHAEDWPRLLDVVSWLRANPRPGIYLRQVDLPGVHSKFIESHRGLLGELLGHVLPPEAIDSNATGVNRFCQRYGFRDKPVRVRLRILDPALALLDTHADQDITLTADAFSQLNLPAKQVFVTENEINFLAFPEVSRSMVVFGAGYGFDTLAGVDWLRHRRLRYWGDIDTHGFAILDELRSHFPDAESFLMDRDTLLAHRAQWAREPNPTHRELGHLTSAESALYHELRDNQLGDSVRLEQERIGFAWLCGALED